MPEHEHQQDPKDDNQLPGKILIHEKPVVRRLVVSSFCKPRAAPQRRDDARPATETYFPSSAVVTDTTDARLTSSFRLSGGTRRTSASSFRLMIVPRKPAAGDDLVARLQFAQHRLPLLLLPLLRHDQQKVEDGKDKQQGSKSKQTRATGNLQPHRQSAVIPDKMISAAKSILCNEISDERQERCRRFLEAQPLQRAQVCCFCR